MSRVTITAVTFSSPGGPRLEGRLAMPEEAPRGAAIVCHPHPQYQGSMSSILVPPLARALAQRGWVTLRFNFRGVGRSDGVFDAGIGETDDARAALERVAAEAPGRPVVVAGWSFGSIVGLRAAIADERVSRYAGVAPPVSWSATGVVPPTPDVSAWPGAALLCGGTEDPFCKPRDLQALAARFTKGEGRIFPGADHFFTNSKDDLVAAVADFLVA